MTRSFRFLLTFLLGFAVTFGIASGPVLAQDAPILKQLKNISTLSSTLPANGDENPYGLVRVARSAGNLQEGSYLVSNFNNSASLGNQQGTGTTIVQISPGGSFSTFATINPATLPGPCPGGVGLTTALAVLRTGWVIVGSLPTSDGTSATAQAGCLIVLDSQGNTVETFYGSLINGPWDMAYRDDDQHAVLFVTNVLNGTVAAMGSVVNQGTVIRVNLSVSESQMPVLNSLTVIASGFSEHTDPAALVIGPTGLGLSPSEQFDFDWDHEDGSVLYVADTVNNRIAVIDRPFTRHAPSGNGKTLTMGGALNGPLGMTVAPNGHIITVNGGDGNAVETTAFGHQVFVRQLDNTPAPPPGLPGSGALFGVLFDPEQGLIFVDDATNTLNKLQ
jgi:hypothetical protein